MPGGFSNHKLGTKTCEAGTDIARVQSKTCEAGADAVLSVRLRMKTASNVLVRQIQEQIVERAARPAWAQQEYSGAVSQVVELVAKAFDAAWMDPSSAKNL